MWQSYGRHSRAAGTMSADGLSPTVIYQAADLHQAHLLVSLLAEYNIRALISGDRLLGGSGELTHWSGAARVSVPHRDAELARRIAASFDRHIVTSSAVTAEEFEPGADPISWDLWPTCARCDQHRLTRCPVCHTAGVSFALADDFWAEPIAAADPGGGEAAPLLMCEVCDEAFRPSFYRICPWCGADAGTGIDATLPPAAGPTRARNLALWAGWGMIAVALASLLYLLQ